MSLAAEGERTLMLIDHEPQAGDFLAEVLAGFTQSPRRLPCKYFYDHKGSLLFDAICELPEYYPTRTELGVMREHLAEMADVIGPRVQLVEFGSGSSLKTRLLLRRLREPGAYVPIEISRTHLLASARRLARQFPRLAVTPVFRSLASLPTINAYRVPINVIVELINEQCLRRCNAKRVRLGLAYSNALAKRAAELLARVGQPHKWTGGRREAAKASPDRGEPQ